MERDRRPEGGVRQGDNLDRARIAELTGEPERTTDRVSLVDWLDGWIAADPEPSDALDPLPGVVHHLADWWVRRDESNVVLIHYDDLVTDLDGEMARLAATLGS